MAVRGRTPHNNQAAKQLIFSPHYTFGAETVMVLLSDGTNPGGKVRLSGAHLYMRIENEAVS
jgi:hypothetical protein